MSTIMAMASSSSSLNPNAPLFIPAAYRRVEDFSPQWWDLVQTTAWFRDHWFRQQHQLHDEEVEDDAALAALPDDLRLLDTDDLFYAPPDLHRHHQEPRAAQALLSRGGAVPYSPWEEQQQQQQPRHADKPEQQHKAAAARRVIHQPR